MRNSQYDLVSSKIFDEQKDVKIKLYKSKSFRFFLFCQQNIISVNIYDSVIFWQIYTKKCNIENVYKRKLNKNVWQFSLFSTNYKNIMEKKHQTVTNLNNYCNWNASGSGLSFFQNFEIRSRSSKLLCWSRYIVWVSGGLLDMND